MQTEERKATATLYFIEARGRTLADTIKLHLPTILPMATIQDLENRYKVLNEDFNLLTSKKYPATTAQLEEYKTKTGMEISNDFQQFLTTFGELIIEVNDTVRRKPEEFSVLPMWKFGYGIFVFGFSRHPDSPHWLTDDYYFSSEATTELGQLFSNIR